MADNTTPRSAEQRARAQALGLPLYSLAWPRAGIWVIYAGVLAIVANVGRWVKTTQQVPLGPADEGYDENAETQATKLIEQTPTLGSALRAA